jgi:DNA-binding NtrC family response regulator
VAARQFREDLYFRLSVFPITIPPLRERPDDILLLAHLFVKQATALHGKPSLTLNAGAEAALLDYSWPGNVRELQNRITRAVLFSDGADIGASDLWGLPRSEDRPEGPATPAAGTSGPAAASNEKAAEEAARRLRIALAAEIDTALRTGRPPPPVGRWLAQDLVLVADRLAAGVGRRAAQSLGIAETTYRRRRYQAVRPRSASEGARPPSWSEVTSALGDLLRQRGGETDLSCWVEDCLLDEILARVPADVRAAAALLGVSQPTLARRVVRHGLLGSWASAPRPAQAAPLAKQRRADVLNSPTPRRTLQRKH